jgi:hypothetical protein
MGQTAGKPGGLLVMQDMARDVSSSSSEELYSADDEGEDESKEKLLPGGEEGEVAGGVRQQERWWTMGLQVFFPFLIAGFGMVAAGLGKQQM